jgi:hypothetical protein
MSLPSSLAGIALPMPVIYPLERTLSSGSGSHDKDAAMINPLKSADAILGAPERSSSPGKGGRHRRNSSDLGLLTDSTDSAVKHFLSSDNFEHASGDDNNASSTSGAAAGTVSAYPVASSPFADVLDVIGGAGDFIAATTPMSVDHQPSSAMPAYRPFSERGFLEELTAVSERFVFNSSSASRLDLRPFESLAAELGHGARDDGDESRNEFGMMDATEAPSPFSSLQHVANAAAPPAAAAADSHPYSTPDEMPVPAPAALDVSTDLEAMQIFEEAINAVAAAAIASERDADDGAGVGSSSPDVLSTDFFGSQNTTTADEQTAESEAGFVPGSSGPSTASPIDEMSLMQAADEDVDADGIFFFLRCLLPEKKKKEKKNGSS